MPKQMRIIDDAATAVDIAGIVAKLVEENPGRVIEAMKNPSLINWFVVQAFKAVRAAGGEASPDELKAMFQRQIEK